MQYIPLSQERFAIVDDEDYERINQWKWSASRRGNQCYAVRSLAHESRIRTRPMHHEVLELPLAEGQKWVVDHTESLSGRDHTPEWPVINLNNSEREGERSGIYTVIFEDSEGKSYSYETQLEDWQRYEIGQGVILKLNSSGEIKEVERQ